MQNNRKKYEKPELTSHGDLKNITKGGNPGGRDSEGRFQPGS